MRLIDADALIRAHIVDNANDDAEVISRYDVNCAPTVDAVEVVRCKDCKYSTPDIMSEDYRACWERNTVMPNDGFCSYGERKEVTHEET